MIDLDAQVTRKQFLASIGIGLISAASLGVGASIISPRLPTEGEYGWGGYGERHYG